MTYSHFLKPLSIKNLPSNLSITSPLLFILKLNAKKGILPPIAKKQRSRPKTKRIRKGAYKRKETHCRNCKETGHNIRCCPHAPAPYGRQQRARDRELSLDSSSESSNSSDSSDSDKSDEVEDRQFRREMDEYDTIMANAHEIAKRELQRQELDSDDDLSVLDSRLFDRMEGSEQGGNSQDDQGDHDGQAEMDGIEIGDSSEVQGTIRGNSEVQGPVFSPRKTRSGQVVKYHSEK